MADLLNRVEVRQMPEVLMLTLKLLLQEVLLGLLMKALCGEIALCSVARMLTVFVNQFDQVLRVSIIAAALKI